MSEQVAPPVPSARGPAPPLPEKPPSVAERTRLLKSSFRNEDGEKPKVPEKPRPAQQHQHQQQQPPPSVQHQAEYQQQNRRSNGSLSNGERSPSPPSSVASGLPQKPAVPEKSMGQASFGDSNKEANGRSAPAGNAPSVCITFLFDYSKECLNFILCINSPPPPLPAILLTVLVLSCRDVASQLFSIFLKLEKLNELFDFIKIDPISGNKSEP
ncbi:hypothetical protein ElyMa_003625000 [Elysia marginata]|uniref:WH2 domain-containing protein n=1 Tax=Elysia marginata TaxID=1093978 RepID=A0AAV4ETQ6_9GAST|nr:hypothetical protein ElyMa_003625000 [Elysia marginata]